MFWIRKRKAIPPEIRQRAFDAADNKCCLCGDDRRAFLAIDHIWPLVLGGTNDLKNLRVLCKNCNSRKGGYMTPADALRQHPELRPGDFLYPDPFDFRLNGNGRNEETDDRSRVCLRDDMVPVFVPAEIREQVVEFVQGLRSAMPRRFPEYLNGDDLPVSARELILKHEETPADRAKALRAKPRRGRNPGVELTLAERSYGARSRRA